MRHPKGAYPNTVFVYLVIEDGNGSLRWRWGHIENNVKDDSPEMKRCNNMDRELVTEEEAEQITGMYAPAAWDCLRELVHESTYDPYGAA